MGALRESLDLFLKGGEDTVETNTLISALSWGPQKGRVADVRNTWTSPQ